jgi:hypothetical protein
MLAALQPALDAVALKFELGLKELKADLGEIVILRDHITAQDTKIASLQARLRAPPKIIDNNVIPWDIPSPQNLPPPPGLRVHLKASEIFLRSHHPPLLFNLFIVSGLRCQAKGKQRSKQRQRQNKLQRSLNPRQ